MLISPAEQRRLGVRPARVVHAGAHVGQEAATYRAMGVREVLWIEANPNLLAELVENVAPYGHDVLHACLGETTGAEVTLHVAESDNYTNHGQSSSLLPLGTHTDKHPEVTYVDDITMTTLTLDDAVRALWPEWLDDPAPPTMLNADLQGLEGAVFAGAPDTLAAASWVMSEVNIDELYLGCTLLEELDALLVAAGFELVTVVTAGCRRRDCSDGGNRWVGWGDGLWVRRDAARPFADTHPDDAADWYTNVERARA